MAPKSSTKKTETVAAAPVPEVVAAPAPAAPKKEKAPKKEAKKEEVAPTPVAVASNPVVETSVPTEAAPAATEAKKSYDVEDIYAKINGAIASLVAARTALRTAEKEHNKEMANAIKAASKKKKRVKKEVDPSKPKNNGFLQPQLVSDALCAFLGKEAGSMVSRAEVTTFIKEYVTANNLKNPTNGQKILFDAKLAAVLNLEKDFELTYFNLQKKINPHFPPKKTKPTAAATA